MELKIPLTKKSEREMARMGYEEWRSKRKTSKLYLCTLFAMCEGVCPFCGVKMILSFDIHYNNYPNSASLDHTIPLAETKEHKRYGLRIMCKKCNSSNKFNGQNI